jgi:hypothetical protein
MTITVGVVTTRPRLSRKEIYGQQVGTLLRVWHLDSIKARCILLIFIKGSQEDSKE